MSDHPDRCAQTAPYTWEVRCSDALTFFQSLDAQTVDLVYIDPPYSTGRDFGVYVDRFPTLDDYLAFLTARIAAARDTLSPTGNFVLHLDPSVSHYAKVEVDKLFGRSQFRNEIMWCYASGGASKRWLSRKHDVLLWWSRSDEYLFNVLREPYATPNVEGRPGFHADGRMMTDVWMIPFLSTTAAERTGYPTQKPLALLERVVDVFTPTGGLVVDGFCGSGTTGVAAYTRGRSTIVNDENPAAVAIATDRLTDSSRDLRLPL